MVKERVPALAGDVDKSLARIVEALDAFSTLCVTTKEPDLRAQAVMNRLAQVTCPLDQWLPPRGTIGRPRLLVGDVLFGILLRHHRGLSARQLGPFLDWAYDKEILLEKPHFNTVLRYERDPSLTPVLQGLAWWLGLPWAGLGNRDLARIVAAALVASDVGTQDLASYIVAATAAVRSAPSRP